MQKNARMKREISMLQGNPPHGISCWSKGDTLDQLEAQILGADDTPYHGGIFRLEIHIPDRYPFEPPKLRFLTPIYHPNIDNAGRICLDSLKMPPQGNWTPALNLSTLLTTVQQLMAEPNPDDPLMTDIANEFRYKKAEFDVKAKEWTLKHATQKKNESLSVRGKAASSSEDSSSDDENDESASKRKRPSIAHSKDVACKRAKDNKTS